MKLSKQKRDIKDAKKNHENGTKIENDSIEESFNTCSKNLGSVKI
jgi:hypothetical protein